jgi:hypothetical protein
MIKQSILSIFILIVSFGCAQKQALVYHYDIIRGVRSQSKYRTNEVKTGSYSLKNISV